MESAAGGGAGVRDPTGGPRGTYPPRTPPASMEPPLLLPRRRIARLLAASSAFVIGAGLAVEIAKDAWGLSATTGVVPHLSLSYEANLPTWYSSVLLLACSLLLAIAATHAQRKS